MLNYIRNILGEYTPLQGVDGIASLDVEYIVQAIILILVIWLCFKAILFALQSIFRIK